VTRLKIQALLGGLGILVVSLGPFSRDVAHAAPGIALTQVASGMTGLVTVTHAGDGTGRLFLTEQAGRIKVRSATGVVSTFLDISSLVRAPGDAGAGGEEGMQSIAFHPSYSTNGHLFVYYTDNNSDNVVARYTASPTTANTVNTNTGQVLLTITHPGQTIHNGGQLQFGPKDGHLYVSTGDGGPGGDPNDNAQDLTKLLGKVLRITPATGATATYTVPTGNPFVDGTGGNADEVWAYGLRNPYRFSFDRNTGDMFIGDVGEGSREEVDFQADRVGGLNYGWPFREGSECFPPQGSCNVGGLTAPIIDYSSNPHPAAVTGGYMYRGPPNYLSGNYVYADFYRGTIWTAHFNGTSWVENLAIDTNLQISSFGEDQAGNLYLTHYGGTVHKFEAVCPSSISGNWFAYDGAFKGGVHVATGDLDGDGCDEVVTGAGEGGGAHVRVFRSDGTPLAGVFPFPTGFYGGVRIAVGDVTGDSREEVITAAGPTGGSHVRVYRLDGTTLQEVSGFFAYPDGFTGGVWVAAADVGGADSKAEIITGAGEGGGSHVRVFDHNGTPLSGFFAYPDGFTGGVRVAAANLDGTPKLEIITGAGPGGGAHVRTFRASGEVYPLGFFAYPDGFYGGVFVAGGELDGASANQEIVTGAGQTGGAHVRVFGSDGSERSGFFAYPTGFYGGVRVAVGDGNNNGDAEIVTGAGPSGGPHVTLVE
jgi:glucose/arabinose dehydrogenase